MRDQSEILEEVLNEQRISNALLRTLATEELNTLLDALAADPIDGVLVRTLVDGQEAAASLTAAVTKEAKVTARAVRLHAAQLIDDGVIQRIGAGSQVEYRLTGLFSSAQLARLPSANQARKHKSPNK